MRDYIRAQENMRTLEYSIYVRIDPRDQAVRYIGLTSNIKVRTQQLMNLPGENNRLDAWVRELQSLDLSPLTEILETVISWEKATKRENYWIQHYLQQGAVLLNWRVRGQPRAPQRKRCVVPKIYRQAKYSYTHMRWMPLQE